MLRKEVTRDVKRVNLLQNDDDLIQKGASFFYGSSLDVASDETKEWSDASFVR